MVCCIQAYVQRWVGVCDLCLVNMYPLAKYRMGLIFYPFYLWVDILSSRYETLSISSFLGVGFNFYCTPIWWKIMSLLSSKKLIPMNLVSILIFELTCGLDPPILKIWTLGSLVSQTEGTFSGWGWYVGRRSSSLRYEVEDIFFLVWVGVGF